MPAILLVRHAQASFGGPDYDVLSETGIRQAAVLDRAFAARDLDSVAVVTGPARRQRDTAQLCELTRAGAPVVEDPRWAEYDSEGLVGRYTDKPLSLTDGATTSEQFQERLDPVLAKWVTAEPQDDPHLARVPRHHQGRPRTRGAALERGQTGLVFTSAGSIAAAVCSVLDLNPLTFIPLNRVQVNAAVTKIVVGRRGTSLISFNEHGHLEHDRELVTYR